MFFGNLHPCTLICQEYQIAPPKNNTSHPIDNQLFFLISSMNHMELEGIISSKELFSHVVGLEFNKPQFGIKSE